jgi:heme/copper-type cytochrome/quinol oxidase subunit 2
MNPTVAGGIFWFAAGCCLIAQVALVWSAIRSPMTGSPENPVAMPRRSGEIAWTIVPAIALIALLVFTWRAMHPAPMSGMPDMPAAHRTIEE